MRYSLIGALGIVRMDEDTCEGARDHDTVTLDELRIVRLLEPGRTKRMESFTWTKVTLPGRP